MTFVDIYLGETEIERLEFWRNFYIEQDSAGSLFWDIDGRNPKVGTIKAWIQFGDSDPRIVGILPDWQVVVDGVSLEKRLYEDISSLKKKKVELVKDRYRFIFYF